MSTYRFDCTNYSLGFFKNKDEDAVDSEINYEFEGNDLPTILRNFECFLRGCGFSFSGSLEIVEPVEDLPSLDEDE